MTSIDPRLKIRIRRVERGEEPDKTISGFVKIAEYKREETIVLLKKEGFTVYEIEGTIFTFHDTLLSVVARVSQMNIAGLLQIELAKSMGLTD